MDIARDDTAKRHDWVLRGFRQFDAPVSIVVTYDRSIQGSDIAPFDCGGVVNCIVNAAWSRGLGCVINSQGIMQSPVVRAEAGIPDDQVIQTCIAMGWPDDSFPANAVVSERKSIDEAAVFPVSIRNSLAAMTTSPQRTREMFMRSRLGDRIVDGR